MLDAWTKKERLCLLARVKWFFCDEPCLFKYCPDQIIRHCIPDSEFRNILSFCYDQACGGHFSRKKTAAKILQCDFYWPILLHNIDVYCQSCDRYQWLGKIIWQNEMSFNPILVVDLRWLRHWLHGPFPMSHRYQFILVAVDYLSKWIEVVACRSNDHEVMVNFLKENAFSYFGFPRAIINDGGKYFCNRNLKS